VERVVGHHFVSSFRSSPELSQNYFDARKIAKFEALEAGHGRIDGVPFRSFELKTEGI
jgi:hypothetical protein